MSSFKHKKLGWTCASLSADFILDLKDVILSRLDELLDLSYIYIKKNLRCLVSSVT